MQPYFSYCAVTQHHVPLQLSTIPGQVFDDTQQFHRTHKHPSWTGTSTFVSKEQNVQDGNLGRAKLVVEHYGAGKHM